MNPTEPSSQPLELTRLMWIALGLVALLGLSRSIGEHAQVRTLVYANTDNPVVVRLGGRAHAFPRLGIKVNPVEGWSYLSVTDDAIADRPTFVNESTHSIISLRRFLFRSWPPIESKVTKRQYENVAIEWIEADHRRLGKVTKGLSQGDVDVTIVVMTHRRKSELSQSVEGFCDAIQWISTSDSR